VIGLARLRVNVTKLSRREVIPLRAGVTDAPNDLDLVNDGHTIVLVANSDAALHNAQAVFTDGPDGQIPAPITYPIPAGATVPLGWFPVDEFGTVLQINVDSAFLTVRAFSTFAPPM
jgi:hypothetical protein